MNKEQALIKYKERIKELQDQGYSISKVEVNFACGHTVIFEEEPELDITCPLCDRGEMADARWLKKPMRLISREGSNPFDRTNL